ncbi:MAG: hypothetical protein Q7W05_02280, partial [Deltaproteobacteria bacterium]|nr:hypothetical protein [Deltaproteobacteria bacterium]
NGSAFSKLVVLNYITVGNGSATPVLATQSPSVTMQSPPTSNEPDNSRPEPLSIISVTDAKVQKPQGNIVDVFVISVKNFYSQVRDRMGSVVKRLPFIPGLLGVG